MIYLQDIKKQFERVERELADLDDIAKKHLARLNSELSELSDMLMMLQVETLDKGPREHMKKYYDHTVCPICSKVMVFDAQVDRTFCEHCGYNHPITDKK